MIDHTLDQVAAAIRRRDEMVTTLRPHIYDFLGDLVAGMIARDIYQLAMQITADAVAVLLKPRAH